MFSVSGELSDEQFVEPGVVSQFRVERCHRTGSVPNENRNAVVLGEDLDGDARGMPSAAGHHRRVVMVVVVVTVFLQPDEASP